MARQTTMRLEEVITTYLQDCAIQGFKTSTIRGYRRTFNCFQRWAETQNIRTVAHFSAENIKRYIAYLQEKTRWSDNPHVPAQTDKLSGTTVRNYVRDLKAFASWLAREGYAPVNPLQTVRKPKADEVPPTPFSQEELDAIFAALDITDTWQFRDYVILHTLWDTGMRISELIGLTVDDINLKECEIRIDHAKWGKWRDVGFGKQTQKYLARYLTMARAEPISVMEKHFFLTVDGRPLSVGAIECVCKRLTRKLGFRVHPHRFRHTFAVNMLRNGTDIRTLQKLMGHASIQILMRYLNLANGEALTAHRVNSPADKHYAQKLAAEGGRRIPVRRVPMGMH